MNHAKTLKNHLVRAWLRFHLLVAIACLLALSCDNVRAEDATTGETRKIVAKVNGQPIYEDQMMPAVEKTLRGFGKHGARQDDDQLVRRIKARVLGKLIGDVLVDQESKKRTVENLDEKVDQKVKELEKKYGAGQGMERYLQIRRLTMDDLRVSLQARVRIDEYLKEQSVLEPEVPEDRIRAMYDEDPESFTTTETVTVSHVLIGVDPHGATAEKAQARQKAEGIRQEILAGKDFGQMAREHSTCNSAAAGGNLGQIKRRYMPAEFEEVAFALKKDAISEVVETKFGYHVIKVIDKHPARVLRYEEMRDFLKKYLQEEESKTKLASHIDELKKQSDIELLLN